MVILDPFLHIVLVGVGYGIFSFIIYETLGKRQEVRKIQKRINNYYREVHHALKHNDEKRLEELQGQQGEISKLTMRSMMYQFLPLLILLPVVSALLRWLGGLYPDFHVRGPSIPIIRPSGEYGYLAVFMVSATLTGLILGQLYAWYNKRRSEK